MPLVLNNVYAKEYTVSYDAAQQDKQVLYIWAKYSTRTKFKLYA